MNIRCDTTDLTRKHMMSGHQYIVWRLVKTRCRRANNKQGTNDCGIHVCVIPVLLSSNIPLQVLGTNHRHWAKAGAELRQRLCLTFETGEYQFRKRIPELQSTEANDAKIEHEDGMCVYSLRPPRLFSCAPHIFSLAGFICTSF